MKALVLINEKSGAVQSIGVERIASMAQSMREHFSGLEIDVVHGEAEALIAAARNCGDIEVIAAAGGDGTQAAIAGALIGCETAQLPLPCGTMNMLCRDLGIPLDIEEALRAGLGGVRDEIDVGLVNGQVFLNNVVFGAFAELAEAREELRDADTLDDISHSLVAGATALFHADPLKFRLTLDHQHTELETNTVMVSNNAISGAENLAPKRDRLDAGKLFVYLTTASHGGDFAAILADFVGGNAENSDDIEMRTCRHCSIGAIGHGFSYSIDGDPVETDDCVTMEIRPRALNVMRPS